MAELGFDPQDEGRRAHYGDFYGLSELPDKPLFAVHGNCQAESLRVLLHGALAGDWHGVRMPPVHELLEQDLPHLHALLPRLSLLVTQPIAAGYRGLPLGTDDVLPRLGVDARVVRVPVMRWTALMPTLAIVRAPGVGDPPIAPYHDLRVLTAAARGERRVDLTPPSADAARAAREESLAQLRLRQEAHRTLDAASLLDAAGPNAVHVINHPGNGVLRAVASAVLDDAGLSAPVPDPGRVLLGGIRAPILESTLEALEHDPAELEGGPHDDWIIHGAHVPAQDIAAEHLRWYAQHPSVVAAGLRRHEHLIQRLGLSA
ncbi:WcbI family polysaccharide biosynthesis putative acetyltransferase [Kocuria rhizophila]|uniref:WcbI family polysaccharide biosynthesis putative acetyltransferase n=1 Tax=Kocuria rhizophila TaxID=72000 RepID=UPI0021A48476|nr:WcbI family polysaccharide biosynthesis putative acetyltransferase [Kocuria rhizophila]MCT1456539.1 WcbI family polysaccharide biosynthesis putative acetyltransferase [Kocuria rhizophila]MCT2248687.1 WcbI family polysaccharide biosynthesis putative acetyltransferase [Kocuria rhizophila]